MPSFIDLTGQQFGQLTVLSLHHKYKESHWLCLCSCGNKSVVRGSALKKNTRSCGCLRHGRIKHGKSKTPEYGLWYHAKNRTEKNGREFSILPEDIIIPERCPILDIPLEWKKGLGKRWKGTPSLDRKDSSKGYTKDNVWVISWRANLLKSNYTKDELQQMLANWPVSEDKQ
jgi:hypothetical protein